MNCTSPIVLRRKDGLSRELPCGSCIACRIARAREWTTRSIHETTEWKCSSFLTLTYSNEHLPPYSSLCPDDLSLFWKRLRHHFHFRYYSCGEYGDQTWRPHYHALLFGIPPCTCNSRPDLPCTCPGREVILKCWPWGSVDKLGTVTYDSARYVADYISKKLTGKSSQFYRDLNIVPPFHTMSKGLGKGYLEKNRTQLLSTQSITIHGVQVGLPRYYANKLQIKPEPWKQPNPSKTRYVWIGPKSKQVHQKMEPVKPQRLQRNKNLKAKAERFKKGNL